MKIRLLIVIFCVVIIALLLWQPHSKPATPTQLVALTQTSNSEAHALPTFRTQESLSASDSNSVQEKVKTYVAHKRADPVWDWKQPINFFGKVVDENNQPVAGADVNYSWSDLSERGTSKDYTQSDGSGNFSVHQTGKRLYMEISKSGYYSSRGARNAIFEYANPAEGLFTPDAANPVLLHLRKKGVGASLVTSQYGMSKSLDIHVPRDGTPVKLDLMQRKEGEGGQIQISELKPEKSNWQQATSWSFKMEIPDGGLVEQNDEFAFEAPESGYQPVIDLNFQQGQTNWTENLQKDYYIKFGSPPSFGRLHIETGISMGGARLTYAINPTGSRNLEPQ